MVDPMDLDLYDDFDYMCSPDDLEPIIPFVCRYVVAILLCVALLLPVALIAWVFESPYRRRYDSI